MDYNFNILKVPELQKFLKDRGVITSNSRRHELLKLCEAAVEINLEIDPDGLNQNKDWLNDKLKTTEGKLMKNPAILQNLSSDLSILPPISIFDIYNYLLTFKEFDHEKLRNYQKMEGYSMFEDGYVIDVHVSNCEISSNDIIENYISILSKVKPRTRDKDPVTKKDFYSTWIITTTDDNFQGGSIYCAFCSCKGGADGSCRHVVATLFECVNFIDDSKKKSVTSGECQWVRRAKIQHTPTLITNLETALESSSNVDTIRPTEDLYNPFFETTILPNPDIFIDSLKRECPSACLLDAIEKRPNKKKHKTMVIAELEVETPMEKAEKFFQTHGQCETCTVNCLLSFQEMLDYTDAQRDNIEKATRGQNENQSWFKMRKGLLTASKFKDILHSTDEKKTALSLFKESSINEDALPMPIEYGRKNESKARDMFFRNHRFIHTKCTLTVPGLIISQSNCFLAASPDGIVKCNECDDFLLEIKCLYKYKGFHPKNAFLMSKIGYKNENDEMFVDKKHKYYYQMQGQMLCAGIYKCVLVIYTNKGIEAIDVPFDAGFCQANEPKLSRFYVNTFYSVLKEELLKQHDT